MDGILRALLILFLMYASFLPLPAEPLQGAIEKNHTLDEWQSNVLPNIKVGEVWNDSMLPKEHTDDVWFPVPPWKAGELTGSVSTEYKFQDGKPVLTGTHKNSFDLLSGQQQDSAGLIWHCARFPNVTTVEGDDKMVVVIGLASKHSQHSSDREIVYEHAIEIARAKDSGKILSVRERSSRARWMPELDGSLLFVHQTLDEKGQPLREGRMVVVRIAPFRREDTLPDGFDLRGSFKRFLLSNGMKDRLPPD